MPMYTPEDERDFKSYVDACCEETKRKGLLWNYLSKGRAEKTWCLAWGPRAAEGEFDQARAWRAAGAALPAAAAAAAQPRIHAAVQDWWDKLDDNPENFCTLQPPVVVPVVALELSDVTNDDVMSYSRFWRNDMCCAV